MKPEDLEISRNKQRDVVSYLGRREALIAAAIAVDEMFPEPPGTRRWRRGMRNPPFLDEFGVTKRGELWLVTREIGWEDQEFICRKHAERKAAREREQEEWEKEKTIKKQLPGLVQALGARYPKLRITECEQTTYMRDTGPRFARQLVTFVGTRQDLLEAGIVTDDLCDRSICERNPPRPAVEYAYHTSVWDQGEFLAAQVFTLLYEGDIRPDGHAAALDIQRTVRRILRGFGFSPSSLKGGAA